MKRSSCSSSICSVRWSSGKGDDTAGRDDNSVQSRSVIVRTVQCTMHVKTGACCRKGDQLLALRRDVGECGGERDGSSVSWPERCMRERERGIWTTAVWERVETMVAGSRKRCAVEEEVVIRLAGVVGNAVSSTVQPPFLRCRVVDWAPVPLALVLLHEVKERPPIFPAKRGRSIYSRQKYSFHPRKMMARACRFWSAQLTHSWLRSCSKRGCTRVRVLRRVTPLLLSVSWSLWGKPWTGGREIHRWVSSKYLTS